MTEKFLNSPDLNGPFYETGVTTPCGGCTLWLSENEAREFKADPDLYAAHYLGLTKEEYLEWIRLEGAALCSERTKSGAQCRAVVSYHPDEAMQWKQRHRMIPCKAHRGREQNYVCTSLQCH
jgi:hypothetical protein